MHTGGNMYTDGNMHTGGAMHTCGTMHTGGTMHTDGNAGCGYNQYTPIMAERVRVEHRLTACHIVLNGFL